MMSSETARSSTQTPSGSVKHPASPAVSVAKKIVAYECEQCNKLFRTKERLILHRQEHVKSEEVEEKGVHFPNQHKQEVQSETEHIKNEKDSQDKLSKSVKLPKLEYQTMLEKISQIEDVRRKEMMLSKKFDFVKSVISKREASTVSIPKSELLFLQEKSSALPSFNQKLDCLCLKLIEVKQLISTKESASGNEESKPDPLKLSNKTETFKVLEKPQKEPKSSLSNRVKLPLTVVANEEKKEKIRLENALGSTYNKLWFIASAIAAFAHLKILCVSGVFFVGSFVVGFGLCWAIIGLGRLWFASMTFSHFGYWLVRRATRRPKGKRFIQSPKYR